MAQSSGTAQQPDDTPGEKILKFRLVVLGESEVGKSCLVLKHIQGTFDENQQKTIGAAFYMQTYYLSDGNAKVEIWDTAGEERYHSLAPMYYRSANAAIVVYAITNQDSFQRAKVWVKELQQQASPNILIALCGNKADLVSERTVDCEEAQAYAEENGLLFKETSAKTAVNVNDIFLSIVKKIPRTGQVQKPARPIERKPDPSTHHYDLWYFLPLLALLLGIFALGFARKRGLHQ